MTVARKPGHREEHEVSRKTIAQGKPELLRLNLWSYPRAFCCTGPMGATGTRLSLHPLISRRVKRDANLGQYMPREYVLASLTNRHAPPPGLAFEPDDRLRRGIRRRSTQNEPRI